MKTVQEEQGYALYGAYGMGLMLLVVACFMEPSAGLLFAIATVVGLVLTGIVLALACGLGMCESAADRFRRQRAPVKSSVKIRSRALNV